MLLALFLIDSAAGLYLFLPLVGRRNAGVKFYRMILIIGGVLAVCAAAAHAMAGRRDLALADSVVAVLTALTYLVLRYPKRLVFKGSATLLGAAYVVAAVLAYDAAVKPSHIAWSIAGALASIALLGSVNLAMLLGDREDRAGRDRDRRVLAVARREGHLLLDARRLGPPRTARALPDGVGDGKDPLDDGRDGDSLRRRGGRGHRRSARRVAVGTCASAALMCRRRRLSAAP
jgi:hypothetical protein